MHDITWSFFYTQLCAFEDELVLNVRMDYITLSSATDYYNGALKLAVMLNLLESTDSEHFAVDFSKRLNYLL